MADSDSKKWDYKQLGVGGGSVLAVLFLFQEKGLDFVSQHQQAKDQIIMERTKVNSERIEKLEASMNALETKLDKGFESIRSQIRVDIGQVTELIRLSSSSRYTKQEHEFYARSVEEKIGRLEDRIQSLDDKLKR